MQKLTTPTRNRITVTIILIVCVLAQGCVEIYEPPSFQKTETATHFHVRYEWSYKGQRWECGFEIPKSNYEYFSQQRRMASYREYVLNPLDDEQMNHVARLFGEKAREQGWGDGETVGFVLSFVQSMPYTSDDVTTGYDEYPRYPVETIADGGGDCEDTAILFASIVREMGYGVVLLKLSDDEHVAAGVRVSQDLVDSWKGSYSLTYYTLAGGEIYAYCETTGSGWELGHKPDDLTSQTAQIIDVF